MPFRRIAVAFSLLFFTGVAANAANEFAGGWGGSLNVTQGCVNGSLNHTMGIVMALKQNGDTVSGGGEMTLSNLDTQKCILSPRPDPLPFQFSGTANGARLTVALRVGSAAGTMTMTAGPTAMNVSLSFPSSALTASGTLIGGAPTTAPTITFSASPSTISAGGSATLSWTTSGATSVSIDNGIGNQPLNGSVAVRPQATTRYVLEAKGSGGRIIASATVNVLTAGPRVVVTRLPAGMLQPAGESGTTDSFTIANVGTGPSAITITKIGDFFSIVPTQFTLDAGARQSIVITASAQPTGPHEGTVTVNGSGVTGAGAIPVRLLVVVAPPPGTVRPRPATARVDVSAPEGQNPSGQVAFTNSGTSAMSGIAISNVRWINPQGGIITINPGETKNVMFSIDRLQRPDSAALLGAVSGTISLRFLGSAGATNSAIHSVIKAATPTSTVSVTIVDIVKPAVSAGVPPPLNFGEIALFLAGHGSTEGILGDLLLWNRGSSTLSNLRLFLSQSSQFATLPQLASNLGINLPSASNIFGTNSAGSLMLRGSVESLITAALRTVNTSGSAAYTSATPVFRSDEGAGPGERIALSGVDRSATSRTILVLQELSGNAGSVEVQAYDGNGAPLGAKLPIPLTAFSAVTDDGLAVVEGARSMVITNTGTGSSRINAYARVRSISTGDAWIVVDPTVAPGSESIIMPMISTPVLPAQTDLYITNTTGAALTATMEIVGSSSRRRAVSHGSGTMQSNVSQQLSILPLETVRTTLTPSNGYIRLTAPARSISASARVIMTSDGNSFGSALPVLATSSATSSGQLKRFSGVGDSSALTVASASTGTFRSSLMLIETAGHEATVRITLRFLLPTGPLVTAQGQASKEISLGPNQMIVINDLGRNIIGAQRDSFGDLPDLQVDIEVLEGSGRVLSYVQSIDNGTGDVVIRPE